MSSHNQSGSKVPQHKRLAQGVAVGKVGQSANPPAAKPQANSAPKGGGKK